MQYFKLILLLSFMLFTNAAFSQSKNIFEVAVEINDQIITNYEISQRILMLQTFGAKNISKNDVINSLIDERLFSHSGNELEVLPNESDVEIGLDNFAKRGNLNKPELLKYLASKNIDEDTLRAYVEAGLTRRKVIQKKFINNIDISQRDVDSAYDLDEILSKNKSNEIEYISLTFSNPLKYDKQLKIFNKIRSNVDNCLDLQSKKNKFDDINLKIHKEKENNLSSYVFDILNSLDINETTVSKDLNGNINLLMLCSRNSKIDKNTQEIIRNKIFNNKITKISNRYLQELKGEAFITIK
ncbi:SurA N-terminal domain-containing protein [Amylibacter sp.]|nr:SurA N-terminal domain-containing protein [Amylibacter sp.]MDC1444579.1 SurA N-terminal domain-containing protein [Amylibacter sp.]